MGDSLSHLDDLLILTNFADFQKVVILQIFRVF